MSSFGAPGAARLRANRCRRASCGRCRSRSRSKENRDNAGEPRLPRWPGSAFRSTPLRPLLQERRKTTATGNSAGGQDRRFHRVYNGWDQSQYGNRAIDVSSGLDALRHNAVNSIADRSPGILQHIQPCGGQCRPPSARGKQKALRLAWRSRGKCQARSANCG
jgi:hypothetical protein